MQELTPKTLGRIPKLSASMKNIEFLDAKKITKNTSKGDSKMLRILVHKTQAPLPIKIIVLSQKSLPGRKHLGTISRVRKPENEKSMSAPRDQTTSERSSIHRKMTAKEQPRDEGESHSEGLSQTIKRNVQGQSASRE